MPHRPNRIRRLLAALTALLCVLSLGVLSVVGAVGTATDTPVSPSYRFAVDDSNLDGVKGTAGAYLTVRRDAYLPLGESIRLAGWLATDKGVSGYRYTWVPAGGGAAEWHTLAAEIGERHDLSAADIPHASGHATAGYRMTIPTPEGLADGYYDVYVRAIDGEGAPCDMLALLHLRYGNADAEDGATRTINFDRLAAEAAANPTVFGNGAQLRADGLYLPDGGTVRLGEFSLDGYESLTVEYHTVSGNPLSAAPRSVLGVKSSDRHPFVTAGVAGYNLTDTLAYSLPTDADGTLTMNLSDCREAGTVWLTAALSEAVVITEIAFVTNGNGTDRVAAKIHFSEALLSQFAGQNAVHMSGVQDPVMGDVLRIEVSENTNDPYVLFYAEQVLGEADVRLSADAYKYMVVWARAMPHNNRSHMTFYLCAGEITGPTEACTTTVALTTDGQWHAYLADLSEKDTWAGVIHSWRFDIINGDCHAGDAVEYASVQFFRTREAAEAAAARKPAEEPPFRIGDPTVTLDRTEEQNGLGTLNPEETYLLPASPAETEAPPVSDPADETPPAVTEAETPSDTALDAHPQTEPDAESEPPPATDASDGGCASTLGVSAFCLSVLAVALGCRTGKSSKKNRPPSA